MELKEQIRILRDRIGNLTDHCSFHKTDRDAKRLLKALKARKAVLSKALKRKGSESPSAEKKEKTPRVKADKPVKRDSDTVKRINSFLESRAKIKAITPIGE